MGHVISYYLEQLGYISEYSIATLYMVAMASNAIIALPIGFLYDRIKGASNNSFASHNTSIYDHGYIDPKIFFIGVVWGVLMGVYETVMRTSIADLIDPCSRAYVYGLCGVAFSSSWTIGNVLISLLIRA